MPASILALLAALLAPPEAPEGPDDRQPPGTSCEVGQNFCCNQVNVSTQSGDGCVAISTENINACSKVLSCGDVWVKIDGQVTCL
jgi:hypothetical protein